MSEHFDRFSHRSSIPMRGAKPISVPKMPTNVSQNKVSAGENTASDVYGTISRTFQDVLNWKSSVEVSTKQKEKKIEELFQSSESQRAFIEKLQVENEKLKAQCTEEMKDRTQLMQKSEIVDQKFLAVKTSIDQVNEQMAFGMNIKNVIDELAGDFANKYDTLAQDYNDLKNILLQEVSSLKEENEMEKQNASSMEASLNSVINDRNNEIKALNEVFEQKEQEQRECHLLIAESKMQLEDMKKDKELLDLQIAQSKCDIDNIFEKVKELEAEKEIFELEKQELAKNYRSACDICNELQISNAQMADTLKHTEEDAKNEVEKLNNTIIDMRAQLNEELKKLNIASSDSEKYQSLLEESEREMANLKLDLEATKGEMNDSLTVMRDREVILVKTLDDTTEEKNDLLLKVKEIEMIKDEIITENATLAKSISTLEEQKFGLEEENEKLKLSLANEQTEKKSYCSSESDLKIMLAASEKKCCALELKLEKNLELSSKKLSDTSEAFEKKNERLANQLNSKKEDIKALKNEVASLKSKVKDLMASYNDSCGKIEEFESDLKASDSRISNQEDKISVMSSSIETKTEVIFELEDTIKSLKLELADSKSAHGKEKKKLNDEVKETSMMTALLEKKTKMMSELEGTIATQKSDLAETKFALEKEKEKVKEAKGTLKSKCENLKNLENDIMFLENELKAEKLKSNLSEISQAEIKIIEGQVAEKDKEIAKLEKQVESLKENSSKTSEEELAKALESRDKWFKNCQDSQRRHSDDLTAKGKEIRDLKHDMIMLKQNHSVEVAKLKVELRKLSQIKLPQTPSDGNSRIQTPTVGNNKIPNPDIGHDKIPTPAVGNAKISTPAVGNAKIPQTPAVGNAKIPQTPTVGNAKVQTPFLQDINQSSQSLRSAINRGFKPSSRNNVPAPISTNPLAALLNKKVEDKCNDSYVSPLDTSDSDYYEIEIGKNKKAKLVSMREKVGKKTPGIPASTPLSDSSKENSVSAFLKQNPASASLRKNPTPASLGKNPTPAAKEQAKVTIEKDFLLPTIEPKTWNKKDAKERMSSAKHPSKKRPIYHPKNDTFPQLSSALLTEPLDPFFFE